MSAILLKHTAVGLAMCSAFLAGVLPVQSESKHAYPETGTVISANTDHGNVYRIETGEKIYRMECIAARMFQSTPPLCEIAGRPIAAKDAVYFRIESTDDDETYAYIPSSGNHEERLLIISTELKVLPPLPAVANPLAGESCAVIGNGMDRVQSQYVVSASSPATPAGPVLAIPVTGGPPVQVIPTGPASGVVTGVPVTGGPPITAIAVAPATTTNTGGTSTVTESEWVYFLRVQTSASVYKLACQSKECWLKNQAPKLGDLLTIRIQNRVAYLSWRSTGPKGEQKFVILSVSNIDASSATPSKHSP
jgi:hypothetical protein